MFSYLTQYVSHLLIARVDRQIKELYVASALMDLATATVLIFEPLYLYSLGWSIKEILLFFAAVYWLYLLAAPLGGKIARAKGFEHTILYSSPFLIGYYLALIAIPWHWAFVPVSIICFAVQKTLYWPSYHADFAWYSHRYDRGQEIGQRVIIRYLILAGAPVLGGIITSLFGFKILFLIASILILVSNIPLFSTREQFTYQSFSYWQAWKRFLKPETLKANLFMLGRGEELLVLTVWPVFIFILIQNYASLGLIITATTAVTLIVTCYIGRISDRGFGFNILRWGTFIYTFVWLARFLVSGTFGIFVVDSLSRLSKNMIDIPLHMSIYERACKLHLMQSIISVQMSVGLAKGISALVAIGLLSFVSQGWGVLWIAGAVWSIFYLTLKR